MTWILGFLVVGFVIYAMVTQYSHTTVTSSPARRFWASLVAAAAALGALIATWFHSAGTPQ